MLNLIVVVLCNPFNPFTFKKMWAISHLALLGRKPENLISRKNLSSQQIA
jgi:hypothetical protein